MTLPSPKQPQRLNTAAQQAFENAELRSDEALVSAAMLGDSRAFSSLVLRYRPALLRVASALARQEKSLTPSLAESLAEDALQEALTQTWNYLDTLREAKRFANWLHVIVLNRTRRLLRKHTRHIPSVALPPHEEDWPSSTRWGLGQSGPLTRLLDDEARERLLEAIDGLPETYRLPLQLHHLDEMPLSRIAALLNLPVSTLKWRLFHGRKQLRQALGSWKESFILEKGLRDA